MPNKTYDVQKGEASRRDSSYRSFLCALLIFIAFCVIVIIAGNWNRIVGNKKEKKIHQDVEEMEQVGVTRVSDLFEKLKISIGTTHATLNSFSTESTRTTPGISDGFITRNSTTTQTPEYISTSRTTTTTGTYAITSIRTTTTSETHNGVTNRGTPTTTGTPNYVSTRQTTAATPNSVTSITTPDGFINRGTLPPGGTPNDFSTRQTTAATPNRVTSATTTDTPDGFINRGTLPTGGTPNDFSTEKNTTTTGSPNGVNYNIKTTATSEIPSNVPNRGSSTTAGIPYHFSTGKTATTTESLYGVISKVTITTANNPNGFNNRGTSTTARTSNDISIGKTATTTGISNDISSIRTTKTSEISNVGAPNGVTSITTATTTGIPNDISSTRTTKTSEIPNAGTPNGVTFITTTAETPNGIITKGTTPTTGTSNDIIATITTTTVGTSSGIISEILAPKQFSTTPTTEPPNGFTIRTTVKIGSSNDFSTKHAAESSNGFKPNNFGNEGENGSTSKDTQSSVASKQTIEVSNTPKFVEVVEGNQKVTTEPMLVDKRLTKSRMLPGKSLIDGEDLITSTTAVSEVSTTPVKDIASAKLHKDNEQLIIETTPATTNAVTTPYQENVNYVKSNTKIVPPTRTHDYSKPTISAIGSIDERHVTTQRDDSSKQSITILPLIQNYDLKMVKDIIRMTTITTSSHSIEESNITGPRETTEVLPNYEKFDSSDKESMQYAKGIVTTPTMKSTVNSIESENHSDTVAKEINAGFTVKYPSSYSATTPLQIIGHEMAATTEYITKKATSSSNGKIGSKHNYVKNIASPIDDYDSIEESTAEDVSPSTEKVSSIVYEESRHVANDKVSYSHVKENDGRMRSNEDDTTNISKDFVHGDRAVTESLISTTKKLVSNFVEKASTPMVHTTAHQSSSSGESSSSVKYDTKYTTPATSVKVTQSTAHLPVIETTEKHDKPTENQNAPTCVKSGCKYVGAQMLTLLNDNTDPCEDFYSFACSGGGPASQIHPSQADSRAWNELLVQTKRISNDGSTHPHLIKFGSFYNSCVDFHYMFSQKERINKVKDILKSFNMDSFSSTNSLDVTDILAKLLTFNSLHFMELSLEIDKQTSTESILQLGLSLDNSIKHGTWSSLAANRRRCKAEKEHEILGPHTNLWGTYESYTKCLQNNKDFKQLLQDAIEVFNYEQSGEVNVHYTTTYIDKLMASYPTPSEIRDSIANKKYTLMRVSDLSKLQPSNCVIEWPRLLSNVTNHQIKDSDSIQVYFVEHIRIWLHTFSQFKEQKWLLIHLLVTDLYYNFVVHRENAHVEDYCMKTTASMFPDITSRLYLQNYPKDVVEAQANRVKYIFTKLKTELSNALSTRNKMSEALKKLQKISVVFSTQEEVASNTELSNKYESLEQPSCYQEFFLAVKQFKMQSLLEPSKYTFGKLVNTFDNDPVSFYEKDEIYVPLAMVMDISMDLPNYIAMAKIGLRLGSALGKHFDPVGIHYRGSVPVHYYNQFTEWANNLVPHLYSMSLGTNENAIQKLSEAGNNLTINQRMSDNIALRLLTDVFPKLPKDSVMPWISADNMKEMEKVMMLSVAQEFCEKSSLFHKVARLQDSSNLPGVVRVNNMFMNSVRFAEVYKCAQGSAMNMAPTKSQFPHPVYLDDDVDGEEAYGDI